jgi:hypothetical protein
MRIVMWSIEARECGWLRLSSLTPEEVIDDIDGPRLFTVRSADGLLLLAYQCGEDRETERFLLVPASEYLISSIKSGTISIRDALAPQAWAWIVDRDRRGEIGAPAIVDVPRLPEKALPRPGVFLHRQPDPLLRIRMVGATLGPTRVPSSVVRRAIDGATGAVKVLVSHVLDTRRVTGRPADWFRRYYDLPTLGFAFKSFEVSFGTPESAAQASPIDADVADDVRRLFKIGLEWAAESSNFDFSDEPDWIAITEALAKLTPPRKGVIERVEIGGALSGSARKPVILTRETTEKISYARKHLANDRRKKIYQGVAREFDKDKMAFALRRANGATIRTVRFSEEQYDEAYEAFESNAPITVFAFEYPDSQAVDLISIAYMSGESEDRDGDAGE